MINFEFQAAILRGIPTFPNLPLLLIPSRGLAIDPFLDVWDAEVLARIPQATMVEGEEVTDEDRELSITRTEDRQSGSTQKQISKILY